MMPKLGRGRRNKKLKLLPRFRGIGSGRVKNFVGGACSQGFIR
jgi:hypothetical protein